MAENYNCEICNIPWHYIIISKEMYVYFCRPGIIKIPIGNLKNESLESIWNSPVAKKIRASILKGSYDYCIRDLCTNIQIQKGFSFKNIKSENNIEADIPPDNINLSFDQSCNLKCPSCRESKVQLKKEEIEELEIGMKKISDYLISLDKKHLIHLTLSGGGDPFVSKIYKNFLFTFDGKNHPNIKICLMTNGVLFDKASWEKMKNIRNNIRIVKISIDAGSKEVYDMIRVGGDWKKLNENLKFISKQKKRGLIEAVNLDFVVQKKNYKDMAKFIELCKKFDFKPDLTKIIAFYDSSHFKDDMIWMEDHPEYKEFINTFKNPVFSWNQINFGNVSRYRDLALNELEKENYEQFLKYKENLNKKNEKDDPNKMEIYYNYRIFSVNKKDIKSLFNTAVVKVMPGLILKYNTTANEWNECSLKEAKIYEFECNQKIKKIWYNDEVYYIKKSEIKSLFNTNIVKINSELILKFDNVGNKWIKCSLEEIKKYKSLYD